MSFLWEKLREIGNPGRCQKALGTQRQKQQAPSYLSPSHREDHGRLVRGNTEGLKAHLPCGFLFCYLLSDIKGKFSGVSQTPTDTLSHVKLINCVERSPEDVPLAFQPKLPSEAVTGRGRGSGHRMGHRVPTPTQDGGGQGGQWRTQESQVPSSHSSAG